MNVMEYKNRGESVSILGKMGAGKLWPVSIVAARPNEGGMLSQNIRMELNPFAGRPVTQTMGGIISVFCPVQSLDVLKDPQAAYAGMTEVIRQKYLSGEPLFGLEADNDIAKHLGINPRKINGALMVNEAARLAHNAAVNALRLQKYHKATLLDKNNVAITPLILQATVLDRLDAVLDPDERINGAVQLALPEVELPVHGILQPLNSAWSGQGTSLFKDAAGNTGTASQLGSKGLNDVPSDTTLSGTQYFATKHIDANGDGVTQNNEIFPNVFVRLNNIVAGNVQLSDFYEAETVDALTREIARIVEENPQDGEDMALRWAHGLRVDAGKHPFVIARREAVFGQTAVRATDTSGVLGETMRTDGALSLGYDVPVPSTELGGFVVTFAYVRPDETMSSMPHPILSDVWTVDNLAADQLKLDPVPVTYRDLDYEVATNSENTVACYTGLNALKRQYQHYGVSRALDPATLENKTALWQVEIPLSVTPDNILYPELPLDLFVDQSGYVATYVVTTNAGIRTPTVFGPSPVETLDVITDENLFDEAQ